MLLRNKVIIISGIGPGLGVKLALHAAQEGARGVVLAARTAAKLDAAEAQIRALNSDCQTLKVVTDICDRNQCDDLVKQTVDTFGRIDALINSAYYHGEFEAIEHADMELWRKVLDTNLIGTMNMTQAVIATMKAQQQGAIVMINTQATRQPAVLDIGGESGYAASKGGLAVASKYLARELGAYGIRVNNAHMGWMWGEPVKSYVQHTAAEQGIPEQNLIDALATNMALKRICTDDECARAALFLASDYASAITGASLDVNGGDFLPL
ncbi:SDR family oxidoreductase [Aestuariicella hydrocarbonica]|uniref:SDR family oxidoreductase n=1 Tax=Pseudomaricurvus hydrocarbonicus TaxID=1470433 RepID=A0A9E5JVN8_9GAMM|nr:SDR family oxidoreductase [Aestuariicella hydrocarbonica]NHO66094.1 SDR family oxidoreductase [Aestuariicella hydrocarbonica]